MFLFSCVISWFSNSTSLNCLLQSWRRQPCAGLPNPHRAGRRVRVALPTPGKSQKMDRETMPWCSLPSANSSHPRATSHCLNNRIIRPVYRRSQLLHWASHRMGRARTSLLGTTRRRSLRLPQARSTLLGTIRLHLQGTTLTLPHTLTQRTSYLEWDAPPFLYATTFASELLDNFFGMRPPRQTPGKVMLRRTWFQIIPVHVCSLCHSPGVLLKQVTSRAWIWSSC